MTARQSMGHVVQRAIILWAFLVCGGGASLATASDSPVFSFGVTPQHSPAEQAKLWIPICQYITKRTGHQIQFKTSKDLTTFWKEADAGAFDLLYINPYHLIKAQKEAGYRVLGKDATPLVAMIITRRDAPDEPEWLKGEKVAVHDVSSFVMAYARYGFLKEHGVSVEPVGVGSVESVYRAVDKGLYPAGVTIQRAWGLLDRATQARFNVLWQSDSLPPFAYGVHPRVPPQVVDTIRQALFGMNDDAEGRALLAKVNIKAIVAGKDSDFNSLRKMKLE